MDLKKLKMNSGSRTFFVRFKVIDDFSSQAAKMKSVRGALLDLRTVCAASEENYRAILSHLGSEVEIAARYVRFLNQIKSCINRSHQPVNRCNRFQAHVRLPRRGHRRRQDAALGPGDGQGEADDARLVRGCSGGDFYRFYQEHTLDCIFLSKRVRVTCSGGQKGSQN